MIYNSSSLFAEQITNLYLYGQLTKPTDLSTLPTRTADANFNGLMGSDTINFILFPF